MDISFRVSKMYIFCLILLRLMFYQISNIILNRITKENTPKEMTDIQKPIQPITQNPIFPSINLLKKKSVNVNPTRPQMHSITLQFWQHTATIALLFHPRKLFTYQQSHNIFYTHIGISLYLCHQIHTSEFTYLNLRRLHTP